jgi:hypothetical protein
MREVILVAGPPCAGKTTYVAAHARPGDLVLDQDELGARVMQRAVVRVAAMPAGRAWVIRCAPNPERRQQLAEQIRADRVVLLVPPMEVLHERAKQRPDIRRQMQTIRAWFAREAANPAVAGRPAEVVPVRRSRVW